MANPAFVREGLEPNLIHVIEECSEVTKVICKITRFGIEDIAPGKTLTNGEKLRAEIKDLRDALDRLERALPNPSDSRQERIAELKREIAHVESEFIGPANLERLTLIRSELSRLQAESLPLPFTRENLTAIIKDAVQNHLAGQWCWDKAADDILSAFAAPQPDALRKALERIQTWLRCCDLPKDAVVNFAPFGKYQATPLLLSDLRNAFAALSTPAPAQRETIASYETKQGRTYDDTTVYTWYCMTIKGFNYPGPPREHPHTIDFNEEFHVKPLVEWINANCSTQSDEDKPMTLTDDQIKHMVDRFLSWKLPQNFTPDNGISYARPNYHPNVDASPSGTNLLDATQAEAMVRHMIDGLAVPQSDERAGLERAAKESSDGK